MTSMPPTPQRSSSSHSIVSRSRAHPGIAEADRASPRAGRRYVESFPRRSDQTAQRPSAAPWRDREKCAEDVDNLGSVVECVSLVSVVSACDLIEAAGGKACGTRPAEPGGELRPALQRPGMSFPSRRGCSTSEVGAGLAHRRSASRNAAAFEAIEEPLSAWMSMT